MSVTCKELERHNELRIKPKYGDSVPYDMPRGAAVALLPLAAPIAEPSPGRGLSGDRSEYERPKWRNGGMRRIFISFFASRSMPKLFGSQLSLSFEIVHLSRVVDHPAAVASLVVLCVWNVNESLAR